jgi:protein SCO1/2
MKSHYECISWRMAIVLMVFSVLIACGLVSCTKGAQEQARRYHLKGKVISVDTKNGFVEVDHEAIPGFMAAMTMPYPVPDTRTLAALAEGDEITADVLVTSEGAHLENIVVMKKGGAGKAPPAS